MAAKYTGGTGNVGDHGRGVNPARDGLTHGTGGDAYNSGDSSAGSGIVETPTSGSSPKAGRITKKKKKESEREKEGGVIWHRQEGDDNDEESDFGEGEGVPLKRLEPKKHEKSNNNKDGNRKADVHTDDELVVRWSQDGGSPTSFRKLREQHRRGSYSTAGTKKKTKKKRRAEGISGSEYEEFGGPLVGNRDGEGYDGGKGVFYSQEEERRVVRKMDKKLVGFLAGLYMLSFLDRSSEFALFFPGVRDYYILCMI